MKRIVFSLVLCLLALPVLAGELPRGLSPQMPLNVDVATGTLSFLAELNPRKVGDTLQHFVVFKDGDYAEKALFKGYITPRQFFDSMVLLGLKAGENMTMQNWNTTQVEGDALRIMVTVEGMAKSMDINELIKDPGGRHIDMRFGGNLNTATRPGASGCLICLFSCPMGIVSNHQALFKEISGLGNVKYRAQGLPEKEAWAVVSISRK
jgi:hypothetical protein